ncbi:MAG: type IX secretion system sortase PorU [Melioribacteraceae bacterium]|nr:type IX secretion system sortase PorU [Melioribacteraceae bacterium]
MKSKIFFSVFLFFYVLSISAQELRIVSSDNNSVIIEYKPIYKDTLTIKSWNQQYFSFYVSDLILENETEIGDASQLVRKINVGVPSEFGNTIQILSSNFTVFNGNLVPVKNYEIDETTDDAYETSEKYPQTSEIDLVTFGEFGLIRSLPVQTININPIQFNASSRTIKLYDKILFKINFGTPDAPVTRSTDKIVENSVINYNVAKNWSRADVRSLNKSTSTVLSQGTWYKFEAPHEGIYKITASDIEKMGMDAGEVDPRTIKIFNNGGIQLKETISDEQLNGLSEIAIKIVGEEDGKFDSNDYILMYGRGTDFFDLDDSGEEVKRYKHPFSLKNYFFITSGGSNGKRIEAKQNVNGNADIQQSSTEAFYSYEVDNLKIGETGRQYYDNEEFSLNTKSRSFVIPIKHHVAGSSSMFSYAFVNTAENSIVLSVQIDGNSVSSSVVSNSRKYYYGGRLEKNFSYNKELNEMSIFKLSYNATASQHKGYLDYFEIAYDKELKAVSDSLIFYSNINRGIVEYKLTDFSNSSLELYDISDYANVKLVNGASVNGGQIIFKSEETEVNRSKYFAINKNKYKSITNIEQVSNSNIRGIEDGAEFIIIASQDFRTQAERLANFRNNEAPEKISTKIIDRDELFNEFSCGSLDPVAIRDFLKYAFDNWNTKPSFVLLFGDGSYDYYNLSGENKNIIPTYQTVESLSELASYPIDDYYARISGNDSFLDLALGRFCCDSEEEAQSLVDKIIAYETNAPQGVWRNEITLVADDAWTPSSTTETLHTRQSEELSKDIIPTSFNQNKIYLGEYEETIVGSGRRKPEVNTEIINAINNGSLLVNYTGHGNPKVWADERVFVLNEALSKIENDKFFFLTAATCDFAYYDNHEDKSAAEELFLMNDKGSIGVFAAARLVIAGANSELNKKFYQNLFLKDVGGLPLRIGAVFMNAKNEYYPSSANTKKYHLFADPCLRLKIPVKEIKIDSVNGNSFTQIVQLKALSKTSISGHVLNGAGLVDNNFNGEAIISVFDSERIVDLKDANYSMIDQGGILFRGRASITNGEFKANFIMPKDISYENQTGKIVVYSFNATDDGIGFTDKLVVGGTDTTKVTDKKGPEVEIFYDDASFENSYLVNPNFNLIVNVSDDSGLNTTGTGIGHKLEGILNDDIEKPIDLTNYFVGDKDADGKSGVINYSFLGLESGEYKIKVKAWDVYNNPGESESYFSVVNETGLAVRNVVNYPNPFSANTVFTFQHNLTIDVDVKIKIYTVAGRLIREIEENNILEKFVKIPWDGRDEDGDNLASGTYLYKLNVKTSDGEYNNNILGKLSVIR